MRKHVVLMAALLALAPWRAAAGPAEDCDRLAADPGVALEAIEAPAALAALAACAAASEAAPDEPRFTHQHARALERAGERAAALRLYKWAAEDGYPPAALALERLGGAAPATAAAQARDALADYAKAAGASPEALAAALGRDMALASHIALARGPEAALAARSASSAEMAALMKALLKSAAPDLQTRYALCALTPAGAKALADRARAAKAPPASLKPEALETLAAAPDTPDAARPPLKAMAAQWRAALTEAAVEADAMAADFGRAAVKLEAAPKLEADAAHTPHLLVDVKTAQGWSSWNPALGGALDQAHCASAAPAQEIPEALRAKLKVAVFVEEEPEGGGAPVRRALLKEEIPFDALPPGGAVLAFAENWGLTPPDAKPARGAADQTPVLIAGTTRRFGEALRLPRPPSAPPETGEAIGGKLSEAIKAFDETAEPAPAVGRAPDRARRLWMEASAAGPLGETPVALWEAFDRRAAMAPLPDAGGVYLPMMAAIGLSPLGGAGANARGASPDSDPADAALKGVAGAASGFEPLRRAVFAAIAPGAPAPSARGTGLLMTLWEARPPEKAGGPLGLRARVHMLRPPEPAAGPEALMQAARWAAASVAAERLIATAGDDQAKPHDALSVFARARAAGGAVRALKTMKDLDGVRLSDQARGRIAARLAAGEILLAPESALKAGEDAGLVWWAAAPGQGVILDEFADGGRSELPETGLLHRMGCYAAAHFVKIGIATGLVMALVGVVSNDGDMADNGLDLAQNLSELGDSAKEGLAAALAARGLCL